MKTDLKKLISDAFLISICWFGAYFLRVALTPFFSYEINPIDSYIIAYPFILFFWIITAFYMGIYRRFVEGGISEVIQGFKAWLISVLISMSFAFIVRELSLARSVLLIFSVICFFVLTAKHFAFSRPQKKKAVIVGTGPLAIRIIQKIEDLGQYEIQGIVSRNPEDLKSKKKIDKYEVVGNISDLKKIAETVDAIIFADEGLTTSILMTIILELDREVPKHINFLVASSGFEAIKYGFDVEFVGDIPLVELGFFSPSPLYDVIKRTFDVVVSSVLLVLLIPVFIIIAIAIKLDSDGPVFFIQERVGKDGKLFKLIKFRTMYKDVPKFSRAPRSAGDPRVTKVGAFLRRWSLDELPQLINVIKGDMSLVGPRPEMPQIVAEYEPWQKERLRVKPGITGLWQILGRKDLPLEENIQYDLIYIKNRSFLLDLIILLKTIPILVKGKGAY